VVAQTGQTGQKLYDASKGMGARRAERKASPLFEIVLVFLRLDRVAYSIVNANHCICDRL
jgi:hypothetical protein